jgi:hypothetical protein
VVTEEYLLYCQFVVQLPAIGADALLPLAEISGQSAGQEPTMQGTALQLPPVHRAQTVASPLSQTLFPQNALDIEDRDKAEELLRLIPQETFVQALPNSVHTQILQPSGAV